MISSRSNFKYEGEVLIEKMEIIAPFRYEVMFQNRGCFIYFKERGPKLLSAEVNEQAKSNEAVLLKCGNHFVDLLKDTEDAQVNKVEVIAIHLLPEVLKKLYTGEIPALIEKQNNSKSSQVVVSSDVIAKFIESLEFYFQNPSLVNDDLLELKIRELILLLVQSKNINSVLELVADLYNTNTTNIREVVELHLFSNLKL